MIRRHLTVATTPGLSSVLLWLMLTGFMPAYAADNIADTAGVASQQDGAAPTVPRQLSPEEGRKDLSGFFTIGIVVDVLLVTVFAIWAVGQWRKPRK